MNDKKIKILYLVTQTDPGGAQKYIHDLASKLDKEKFEVEVGVGEGKQEKWMTDLENQNIQVHKLKHVVRNLKPTHDFLSGFEIYSLLNKTKPDVIHLNSSKIGATGAIAGWVYKKLRNRKMKIIYTVHGLVLNEPLPYWQSKYYKISETISGWCEDRIICVSEFDKQSCLKNKIAKPKKLITIHNGIDLDNLNFLTKEEAKKKLGIKNQSIGTIANLYETKGLIYLIRAAKILIDRYKDLSFIVIGDGTLKETLEQEIKKLDLENNFSLIGKKNNAQQYLPAFDIFCLPSVKEGLSYTLIEALAAGLPIVTTNVGGNPEIIEDNANGILIKSKKPLELAEAIEKILENNELKDKFRKNNLEKVKQFSLDEMVRKTEQIYI
jgi:glycosyltransferase involved in cell wall biosynthesis